MHFHRARTVQVAGLSSWWLVGILHRSAYAQPPAPPAPPAELSARLVTLCDRLDKKREEYHIPGMAIAVVKDDKVVLARGFGLRDVEKNAAADENTLFAIGSSTKAFTSALCAMMVDEGKMGWDDPVHAHFPMFTLSDAAAKNATIRDVLSHRTGLARTDVLWFGGTATIEQVYASLGRAKSKDAYQKAFNYNNNAYASAGFAAARVAGTDWDTLVRARIFTPLGMTSSNTSIAATTASPNAAKGYVWDEDEGKFTFRPMRNLALAAPAGAINSTALDMARWVRLQLGRGTFEGASLISKGALETTWTSQIDIAPSVGYGMGWMLHEWNGKRVVEHGGNIDGFAAEVGMLPDEDAGFVLLMNVSASALQGESQGMVWEALVPPETPAGAGAIPASKLAEYAGEYRFSLQGSDVKVLVKDGKLFADVPGQMAYELKWPDEKGRWYFALTNTIAAGFERDEKGKITSMTFYQGGLEMELPRKPIPAPPYTEAELGRYTGEYHFEYLGRSEDWKVHVREGRLAVDVPKQFSFTLRWPDAKGTWAFQELKGPMALTLEFEKDGAGAVVAMNAHQGGMDFRLPRKGGAAQAGVLPTIEALMAKRTASGAALAAAGAVRMTGTVEMPTQGVSGTVTTVFAGTDRFNNALDFPPFGFIHTSCDGKTAWTESLSEEYHEVKGAKREEMIRQGPGTFWADMRTLYDTVEVTGEDTVDGARAIVVQGSKKDGKTRTRALLNPDTGMPLREETTTTVAGIGAIPLTITYSDYRTQGGVVMPFKVTIRSEMSGAVEVAYAKMESVENAAPEMFVLKRVK